MATDRIGKTEVDQSSLELVSQLVNLNLQRALVMPGKFLDLSSEVGPGMDKLKIRKFTDLAVGTKAENTPLEYGISTLSTDDLLLDQHKYVATLMEEFAKIQGPQSFMQELAANAGIKLAQNYDAYLISTLRAGAATGSLATPATVAKADFITARKTLNNANVPLENRFVGIHPDDYASVLNIADFVAAQNYGQSNIPSGVVGSIFGMQVVENTGFTAGELVAWQQNCMAGAVQLSPSVRTQYDPNELGDKWVIHTIFGAKIIRAAAAIKLT